MILPRTQADNQKQLASTASRLGKDEVAQNSGSKGSGGGGCQPTGPSAPRRPHIPPSLTWKSRVQEGTVTLR